MKKCHSEHMKVAPKFIKVTARFDEDSMYRLNHLAVKYNKGCLSECIRDLVARSLSEFNEEISSDIKQNIK